LGACVIAILLPPRALAQAQVKALAPELNAYVKLSDQTRLYLLGDLSIYRPDAPTDGELGAHLDITLIPPLRRGLREADWARERYLWARIGYTVSGAVNGQGPVERRGILELTARAELPEQVWLVNRARLDVRDIGGERSQRYRLRVGVEREFTPGGVPTVPYAQAETFYDTRTGSWNRQLYQTGVEVEISKAWRYEVYVSRQVDSQSPSATVATLGLVLKHYW
jgi:hypothetical protein